MDLWIVEQVQRLHGSALDDVARSLSSLPLRLALLAIAVAVTTAATRSLRPLAVLLVALPAADLITGLAKQLADRPRPPLASELIEPLTAVPASASMPSGHAATAFAAAVVLGAFHPRLRLPALAVAASIATSRVWLGVHYPSDILVGGVLGAVIGLLTVRHVGLGLPHARPHDPPAPPHPSS